MRIVSISLLVIFFTACSKDDVAPVIDVRDEMRSFVMDISAYGKRQRSGFIVIPQNGIELVSTTGDENGAPHEAYLQAIDGNGQEDLFYGYIQDDLETPPDVGDYLQFFLNISKNNGNTVLVTDYCSTPSKMDDSYNVNASNGYVSFAASVRELNVIPDYPAVIAGENAEEITSLSDARNFLYLINPDGFTSRSNFIDVVSKTNYDVLVMDLYFDGREFTFSEIEQLKKKHNGGSRLVISYMSIGEAEDYRYYWDPEWTNNPPAWMDMENPDRAGNYKVKYWDEEWQRIITGNRDSYLRNITDVGFDGVYLDMIDAFEYFE